ncbi:MAG: S-layer family protein, partial [Candidatus Korobacteraceae bacterium]
TIQGGTLNNNGTFLGTPNGNSAILDGSTGAGAITLNGTYINGVGSTTDLLGTINNNNNFLVTAGSGNNSVLTIDSANVTLQGGGTVTLSTATSGGNVIIDQAAGGEILTNVNNTIQGDGIIGFNGLTIVNEVGGTINANSLGGSEITTLTIESAPVTNQGLIEATNNGVLNINGVTINNQGGTISANGAGASVQLFGNADIQGGTLTNNGGAFFGTPNGNTAILDGSTVSGAVTINGTYTNGNNSATFLLGTINNQGNIQVNGGSGNNSELEIDSATVTLTGGGMVTLSTAGGGGSALVFQAAGGETLENFNNTIQGAGIIGFNGLSLLNDVGGTVLANAAGQTLSITGAGTVTNNGTFQANSGSTLLVGSVTSFTNFSGNTLTGGTYNVYGTVSSPGMLQINPLGNTGGEIVNNAATIYLNGPNSNFVDSVGLDALSNFSNNTSSGSFTITNGRNFTSPSSTNFANAGAVIVGSGSTFTTGGTRNYTQSGGSTQLNGSLVAGGGQANFTGGVLYGNGGAITGNVSMAGTIAPAATINGSNVPLTAGSLSITGNYSQTSAGIFNLGIGGLAAGSQFGFLGISGNALIDGTLNVNLINSFFPAVGNTFTFLTTGGSVTGIFATVNGLNIGNNEQLSVMYGANYVEITTLSVTTTDNWLGGTGNWSNGAKWSIGVPASIDDVNIYSGGNDLVTLNLGSTTINSLALGGPTNGFTSELTDGGTAQNLSITNGLSIGANGFLDLTGASTITAATVSNSGSATIGSGATLNLTNQPNGVTSVASGASWTIGGNFSVGGVANTGFANLSSVGGSVTFANGASQTIGSSLTVASGGFFDVEGGSTVTITGNVFNNAGGPQGIYTSFNGTGGNTLNINGNLTNNGMFGLESTDAATIGGTVNNSGSFQLTGGAIGTFTSSLMNTGTVDLENASTLTINGTADNFGTLSTSANGGTGSNNLKVSGLLTNEATGQLSVNGPSDTLKAPGGLTNYGAVTVKNGSTIDPPFVNNLGTINIDATSTFVVGTGTATGPGFIQLSNGTFGEMINSATAFGQVDVAGSASLNGTLDILLHAGYNPAVGTSFTYLLLNPGQLSGTYSNILNDIFNGGTEKWVVNYNDAGGYVQLTAATNSSPVPEPGSFLLLGSGLIGLAYTARRRWMK